MMKSTALLSSSSHRHHRHSTTTMRNTNHPIKEPSTDEWRSYGRARRQFLLENDQARTNIRMNPSCSIHKYFALADRVMQQFQLLCNDGTFIEDAYVMGNRLLTFLNTALPKHPQYKIACVQPQRLKCVDYAESIQEITDKLAIKIDEQQLDAFIENDFDPDLDDDDDDDDDNYHGNHSNNNNSTWEPFDGWAFDTNDDTPGVTDTDESSQDVDEENLASLQLPALENVDGCYDDDDSSYDDECNVVRYEFDTSSSILHKIAKEAVQYETDSEAADSWAQDVIEYNDFHNNPPPPPPNNTPENHEIRSFSNLTALRL